VLAREDIRSETKEKSVQEHLFATLLGEITSAPVVTFDDSNQTEKFASIAFAGQSVL